MGTILQEIRSTDDKGLIGITEKGEEVPLSAPTPIYSPGTLEELGILLGQVGEEDYIQFGGEVQRSLTHIPLIIGNRYQRRN